MGRLKTIAAPFTVSGVGLHSGADVTVMVRPAPAGTGLVFLLDGETVPALVDYVVDTRRCTTLGRDGKSVRTVEHWLAACMIAGVTDVFMEVTGPELPALDGSALSWFNDILRVGVTTLAGEITPWVITEPHWLVAGGSEFFLTPANEYAVYAAVDIPHSAVHNMVAGGAIADAAVVEQLLRARTYGLESEVRALLKSGLARGGSLDNALVITETGYLNMQVWPAEPAWHKALDLLGDLALLGRPITGQVLAVRGGHSAHVELVKFIQQDITTSVGNIPAV
ncbi:MAG: UDP-3-O-acyl-N-acetylglucosamine deacetylase [bacterium]